MDATLPFSVMDAIAAGRHADPFAVLGPHAVEAPGAGGVIVRAFRPDAAEMAIHLRADDRRSRCAASIRKGSSKHSCTAQRSRGSITACVCAGATAPRAELDDPYRYGPVLPRSISICLPRARNMRALTGMGARLDDVGGQARRPLRGVGAQRASRQRRRRLQRRGTDACIQCGRSCRPDSGRSFCPASGRATATSSRSSRRRPGRAQGRPLRPLFRDPAADRVDRLTRTTTHWRDERLAARTALSAGCAFREPMSIYEVHLGSWRSG